MMSISRPNHSGVKVGTVVKCEGRKAVIRLEEPVGKGDVLEIRSSALNANGSFKGEKALYEFTLGENYSSGVMFGVLTMKERSAVPGLEVFRTKNDALLRELREKYLEKDSKCPVKISFTAAVGKESELIFSCAADKGGLAGGAEYISVSVKGNIVDAAKNAPTTSNDVKKQLEKLGDTEFVSAGTEITLEGNLFLPVGELNRLRREAAALIREEILKNTAKPHICEKIFSEKNCPKTAVNRQTDENSQNKKTDNNPEINVLVSDLVQLKKLLNYEFINDIYFDISAYDYIKEDAVFDEVIRLCGEAGRRLLFALPYIIRSKNAGAVRNFAKKYHKNAGFLIRNHEAAALLEGYDCEIRSDYQLYAMNSSAAELSGRAYTVSPELNSQEIRSVAGENSELIIYGLMPVIYSAQCVYKNIYGKCSPTGRCESVHGLIGLTDEKGFRFPTTRLCNDCCNIIYNSSVLNLLHRYEDLLRTGCGRFRLNFTYERASETGLILDCLERVMAKEGYLLPDEIMGMKFTNGHFCRGVE